MKRGIKLPRNIAEMPFRKQSDGYGYVNVNVYPAEKCEAISGRKYDRNVSFIYYNSIRQCAVCYKLHNCVLFQPKTPTVIAHISDFRDVF